MRLLPDFNNLINGDLLMTIDVFDGDVLDLRACASAGIFASSMMTDSAVVLSDSTQTAILDFYATNDVPRARLIRMPSPRRPAAVA